MSVLRDLRKKREGINSAFKELLATGFEDFSQGRYEKDESFDATEMDYNNLSLVQDDDLEKNIAAGNLINHVKDAHQEQLLPLHTRLCEALNLDLPEEACPVGPLQLAQHFKQAIEPMQLDQDMSQLLFKALDKTLVKGAGDLYKSLNKILIADNVLPDDNFASIMRRQHSKSVGRKSSSDSGLNDYLDEEIKQVRSGASAGASGTAIYTAT